MLHHNDMANYQTHMDQWNEISAVRTKENLYNYSTITDKALKDRDWFLESAYPILSHPLLASLEKKEKQYLLGFFLLSFLEYTTVLEHEFVNSVTVEIAQNFYGDILPERMRIDAYKIYTDEAYHAYFTFEGACQIREYLNITRKIGPFLHTRLTKLRDLIQNAKKEDQFLVRLGLVTISETVIAKEIHQQMQGIVIEPTYHMFRDHLLDESRHGLYFSTLFKIIWPQLSKREQETLGFYLPKILSAYAEPNLIELEEGLSALNYLKSDIDQVINEYYTPHFLINSVHKITSATFRLFAQSGVFDSPIIKEYFENAGFNITIQ